MTFQTFWDAAIALGWMGEREMGRGEMSGIHERGKLMVPLSAFSRKKEGEIAKNLSSSLFPGKRVRGGGLHFATHIHARTSAFHILFHPSRSGSGRKIVKYSQTGVRWIVGKKYFFLSRVVKQAFCRTWGITKKPGSILTRHPVVSYSNNNSGGGVWESVRRRRCF